MWGAILGLLGNIAEIAANKIIMSHINTFARLEKERMELEMAPYSDQDDVRLVEVVKLMAIEKNAIAAQLSLMGK